MLWLPFWTLVEDGVNAVYVQASNANLNLFSLGTVVGVMGGGEGEGGGGSKCPLLLFEH